MERYLRDNGFLGPVAVSSGSGASPPQLALQDAPDGEYSDGDNPSVKRTKIDGTCERGPENSGSTERVATSGIADASGCSSYPLGEERVHLRRCPRWHEG